MEEEDVSIAALFGIVEGLETKKNLKESTRKILANLGSRLTNLSIASDSRINDIATDSIINDELKEVDDDEPNEIEDQLSRIEEKIMTLDKEKTVVWDSSPEEAYDYLKAVDEARKLTEILENRSPDGSSEEDTAMLCRAHDVLQTAMAGLEEEFRILLVQYRQSFEPERMSFRSTEDDNMESGSVISSGDDSFEEVVQRDSTGQASYENVMDLLPQDVILFLQRIAHLMFESNYGHECSQVFIAVQKDALDECLDKLEVEKLCIEDVLKMEWEVLNSKIRKWIWEMKTFARYLASEKLLADQIFGDVESWSCTCFVESSRTAILSLLNFCEAVAISPRRPEKFYRILDMYEVLADLMPDIGRLYSDDAGLCVRTEYQDVLGRLRDYARATFLEFQTAVASDVSAKAPGGGVHLLTSYVMNYLKFLAESRTFDEVMRGLDNESSVPPTVSPETSPIHEEQEEEEHSSFNEASSEVHPTERHFRSIILVLERNLDDKSKLYKEVSLQHLFLLNNIHYIAEKVKGSELRTILGDKWIRTRNWKFQQHAMNYERATWSSILALLREEGIQNPASNSISRTILKERLHGFYLAFEEVYRSQTGWTIRDSRLREDLRISAQLKVIQGYRAFVGRHVNYISEKHIKYSADDLQGYLMDLFEGSPKSLHGGHRKSSS